MKAKREDVEKEIIESAKKLFIQNGFRGTTMRDIAAEAGVNLAMLNYYFRSKENLFEIIFDGLFSLVSDNIISIMVVEMSVIEKVRTFVYAYMDALETNSDVPGFIFQELFINPDRLLRKIEKKPMIRENVLKFINQLQKEADEGLIAGVENPVDFFINIISMCAFPFIAKPLVKTVADLSDNEYREQMANRKKVVADFVVNAISV